MSKIDTSRDDLALGRTIRSSPGIGSVAQVVQHAPLLCRRLASDGPGLVLVEKGRKIIRSDDVELTASVGQVVLVPDGCDFDVINEPAADGPYRAVALNFAPALFQELRTGCAPALRRIEVLADPPAAFRQACDVAVQAIAGHQVLPGVVAAARVREILLWLDGFGYRLELRGGDDLVARLRRMLVAEPARSWRAAPVAASIGMSEPSLRRHLAARGTSFTDVLVDVRMTAALYLLQSTDQAITQIALAVGYDSASRFSVRFRSRFGFAPSEIRGHHREFERNGTKYELDGAAPMMAG
ncbi:helix-turn-helix transcriptional regulator [Labrys sp. KNU-23]|uniref:helix-turn-helix transcriptional regulator n=1 Tax=Labrys sp. KNU-23 TaxID=2789216 RepID=UPI0011EBF6BF|nr:AraC family transcriptional regulator [Labrys sp. KNU-23]QEN88141.1 helix-turn-helix transcriptional regulator [Labrys sp. KNU-23]